MERPILVRMRRELLHGLALYAASTALLTLAWLVVLLAVFPRPTLEAAHRVNPSVYALASGLSGVAALGASMIYRAAVLHWHAHRDERALEWVWGGSLMTIGWSVATMGAGILLIGLALQSREIAYPAVSMIVLGTTIGVGGGYWVAPLLDEAASYQGELVYAVGSPGRLFRLHVIPLLGPLFALLAFVSLYALLRAPPRSRGTVLGQS